MYSSKAFSTREKNLKKLTLISVTKMASLTSNIDLFSK